jgi:hypothetical protein
MFLAQRKEIENGIWSSRAPLVLGSSTAHSHFAGAVLAPLTDQTRQVNDGEMHSLEDE